MSFDWFINADYATLYAINGYAGLSPRLDRIVGLLRDNPIVKGMVPVLCIWVLWFSGKHAADRPLLISTAIMSVVAIAVGRGSALLFSFRDRPLHSGVEGLRLPDGTSASTLDGWSSFPSDHAVLYFFLATALFLTSRKIGLLLFAHALLAISLTRVYAALHYPSDIAAGAIIGVLLALLLVRPFARHGVPVFRFMDWEAMHPQSFYPVMFFVSFQMASMFDSLRSLLSALKAIVG